MTTSEALSIWQLALQHPQYVRAISGTLNQLKSTLYDVRAKHLTLCPELLTIEVRTSPLSQTDTLWLGRKGFMEAAPSTIHSPGA